MSEPGVMKFDQASLIAIEHDDFVAATLFAQPTVRAGTTADAFSMSRHDRSRLSHRKICKIKFVRCALGLGHLSSPRAGHSDAKVTVTTSGAALPMTLQDVKTVQTRVLDTAQMDSPELG